MRSFSELRKSIRVDANKQILIDVWDQLNTSSRERAVQNITDWLQPFNTRISVLLRLGLQNNDGSFVDHPLDNDFYEHYVECPGTNIYAKTAHLLPKDLEKAAASTPITTTPRALTNETHAFDDFSDQLGITSHASSTDNGPPPYSSVNLTEMLAVVDVNLTAAQGGDTELETAEPNKLFESWDKLTGEQKEELGDLV